MHKKQKTIIKKIIAENIEQYKETDNIHGRTLNEMPN